MVEKDAPASWNEVTPFERASSAASATSRRNWASISSAVRLDWERLKAA